MDLERVKETGIWTLYQQCVDYCRQMGIFGDTDKNYRMYNGDQWEGLKISGVEKVQYNFIKPIVRYKTAIVLNNHYGINFSSENFESREYVKAAGKVCELLNKKSARIWEKDYMDLKLRLLVKDAAINDEGVVYVTYSEETGLPTNEILNKTDVFYGNENSMDIQTQPYILVKQRMSVIEARLLAEMNGVSGEELLMIMGDNDNMEEAGESAKYEKDEMCTVVTKLYKEKGKVFFEQATRRVVIKKKTNSGLSRYPISHLVWEEKKGSARGEGEVRQLIPNQIETNKTAMRRALTIKNTAYPTKVVNEEMVKNPNAIDKVGTTIKIKGGQSVEDVNKVVGYLRPSQMSTDSEKIQNELIQSTRELAGAGDIATGQINPENASGRAVLAVQKASEEPLTEHLDLTKNCIEELARIWLDMIIAYNKQIQLEETVTDSATGEEFIRPMIVGRDVLISLKATVKVDITPKGAFDKYAQEQSLENLLKAGYFSAERMPELKLYIKTLDDDAVMPKQKLVKMVEEWEAEQKKIQMLQMQAQLMKNQMQQYFGRMEVDAQQQMARPPVMMQGM